MHVGEPDDVAIRMGGDARPVRMGEEGDRRLFADQNEAADLVELLDLLAGGIGQALHDRRTDAALQARIAADRGKPCAGPVGDGGGLDQRFLHQGTVADQDHRLAATKRCGGFLHQFVRNRPPGRCCDGRGDDTALAPGDIGGNDQRRNPALPRLCRRKRLGCILRHRFGRACRGDMRGNGTGDGGDIRGQRRVILQVIGGVLADEIKDRAVGTPRIVQVGAGIHQARAEMQKRCRRLAGHAGITVRRPGHATFEQAEHAAHAGHAVEGRDQMQFGRAGIGKAHFHPGFDQRGNDRFCTIHDFLLTSSRPLSSRTPTKVKRQICKKLLR